MKISYVIMHCTSKNIYMKKLLFAIMFITLSASGSLFAQTTKPAQEKQKTAKKQTAAATTSTQQPTAATAETTKATTTAKVKKDGTPDKRFKENKHTKKDGTPDKRFKENKAKKE